MHAALHYVTRVAALPRFENGQGRPLRRYPRQLLQVPRLLDIPGKIVELNSLVS